MPTIVHDRTNQLKPPPDSQPLVGVFVCLSAFGPPNREISEDELLLRTAHLQVHVPQWPISRRKCSHSALYSPRASRAALLRSQMLTSQHSMDHATAHARWIHRLRRQLDRRKSRQFVEHSAGRPSLSLEVQLNVQHAACNMQRATCNVQAQQLVSALRLSHLMQMHAIHHRRTCAAAGCT